MTMTVTVNHRPDVDTVQGPDTHFGVYEIPETCSTYRVLIQCIGSGVVIGILNWGTSAEFGSLPTADGSAHSIAEHLTSGNLVDARNLIEVFRSIEAEWPEPTSSSSTADATTAERVHLHRDDYPQTLRLLGNLLDMPMRRGQGAELGFEPTEYGAYVNWDQLLDSWLSSTEKAVVHIARGTAVLERAGGPSPSMAPVVAGVMLNVCRVGR